jgi:hypothetical protein
MKTLYGELPNELLITYINGLVAKVFKLLPLKEDNSPTLSAYLKSLLRELIGAKELVDELKNNQDFKTLLDVLQSLLNENDMHNYKSDVFKAISTIKRIKSSLDGDLK